MTVVPYKPLTKDYPRSWEDQMRLLAIMADKAWRTWAGEGGAKGVALLDPAHDDAMRALYQQLEQTDIFMSGVHAGRTEEKYIP